jgi:hypothetical protein
MAVSVSLIGAVIGFMVVSSNFDALPYGGAIGATVGVVVGGLAGLFWKSPANDPRCWSSALSSR